MFPNIIPSGRKMQQGDADSAAKQLMALAQSIRIERGITQQEAEAVVTRGLHLQTSRQIADSWREDGGYDEATRQYLAVIEKVMGSDWKVPGWSQKNGVTTDSYANLSAWEIVGMMRVCGGIAECHYKQGDLEGVRLSKSSPSHVYWQFNKFECDGM